MSVLVKPENTTNPMKNNQKPTSFFADYLFSLPTVLSWEINWNVKLLSSFNLNPNPVKRKTIYNPFEWWAANQSGFPSVSPDVFLEFLPYLYL
jgi:hypothetical protein